MCFLHNKGVSGQQSLAGPFFDNRQMLAINASCSFNVLFYYYRLVLVLQLPMELRKTIEHLIWDSGKGWIIDERHQY